MLPSTLRRIAHEAGSCLCGATALGVVLFVVGAITMMTLLPVAASATVLSALLTPTGAQPFALSPTGAVATSAALTALLVLVVVPVFYVAWLFMRPSPGQVRFESPRPLLWTIHNKRYDMRTFVARHPGGADAIRLGRGRNCTVLFESYHSLAARGMENLRQRLDEWYVEDAAPGDADYDDRYRWGEAESPFHHALKERVKAYFAAGAGVPSAFASSGSFGSSASSPDSASSASSASSTSPGPSGPSGSSEGATRRGVGWKAPAAKWARCALFTAATAAAFVAWCYGRSYAVWLLPLMYWWGPSTMMHDGGHFALSHTPWINAAAAWFGSQVHMPISAWQVQHTIAHHMDTNILGKDPDLLHFSHLAEEGGLPGFRISPFQVTETPFFLKCGTQFQTLWRVMMMLVMMMMFVMLLQQLWLL